MRGQAATADVVDASVAIPAAGLARNVAVALLTSNPDDLSHLLTELDAEANIVPV